MKKIKLFGYMVLLSLFFVAGCSNQATKKEASTSNHTTNSNILESSSTTTELAKEINETDEEIIETIDKVYSSWDSIPKEINENNQIWQLQRAVLLENNSIQATFFKKNPINKEIFNGKLTESYSNWNDVKKEITINGKSRRLVSARLVADKAEAYYTEK